MSQTPIATEVKSTRTHRAPEELARLFEKLPPHAIEAEMCLLGSMLLDPQVIGDVLMVLRSGEDFYKPSNGAIYDAMVHLYDQHASLDIVQLNQQLADKDLLETVGGVDYLVQLAGAVPSAANAKHYARLVRDKAMIRQLIGAAGEILQQAYSSPDAAQSIVDQAEQKIFHIAQQNDQTTIESMHDLIHQAIELLEANEGKRITGVPTGFIDLDEITGGLQRGEMVILAARPSMGKTAFALNVAEQMAVAKHPVGVFSLEMGRQQLVQRLLAARSGVDSQRMRRNMINRDEHDRLMAACDQLLYAPIFIDDTPGLSLLQLRAKARRMVAKHEVGAIVIDYLQLMTAGGRTESRQMEVSEISRGVKAMARELNIPVICLSQLNRAAEQREGHRPRMSDLRESGSIEQDADVVAMLHREEYYHQSDDAWAQRMEEYALQGQPEKDLRSVAELIIAKQRNGPTGTVKLTWDSRSTRFRNYTAARSSDGYRAPMSAGSVVGSHTGPRGPFAPGAKTGPVAGFRDGGGPDRDNEDLGDLPV